MEGEREGEGGGGGGGHFNFKREHGVRSVLLITLIFVASVACHFR